MDEKFGHPFSKKGQIGQLVKYICPLARRASGWVCMRRQQRSLRLVTKFCSRCGQKGTIGTIIPRRKYALYKGWCKT